MRLLLDEMYPVRLAEQLRGRGYDVRAVLEIPALVAAPDRDVVDHAAADGRAVVTENVRDFLPLAELSAGLVLVHAVSWPRTRSGQARLADALARWAAVESDLPGGVAWL